MGKIKLPKLWIEYEVRDKDGKLLDKGKFKGQSWVGNITAFLRTLFKGGVTGTSTTPRYYSTSPTDMRDVDGTARGLALFEYSASTRLGAEAEAGVDAYGLRVGASDSAVALGQYNLGIPIVHGSGAGQLLYGNTTVEDLSRNGTWLFRVVRTFTNGSGSTVTVREFGLFVRLEVATVSPYMASIMFARDVPPSPINVPAGSTLTLRYIISQSLS